MTYDSDVELPADAKAAIVAPVDRRRPVRPGHARLHRAATCWPTTSSSPSSRPRCRSSCDQIYESLDTLNVALGPNGANRNGALSDLLAVTADNFDGQGENLRSTLGSFARLTATLDNNKEELFGSAEQLGKFVSTLAENDQTVRSFNQSLSDVSGLLEGEKEELSASLRNLSVALTEVSSFVKDNREVLGRNISGLNRVSKVLVKQRDALDEILRVGPLALNNLALTYNPQAGTLDTRANVGELVNQLSADPATYLCGLTSQVKGADGVCDTIKQVLPRAGALPKGPVPARPDQRFDPSLGGLVEVSR